MSGVTLDRGSVYEGDVEAVNSRDIRRKRLVNTFFIYVIGFYLSALLSICEMFISHLDMNPVNHFGHYDCDTRQRVVNLKHPC